MYEWENPFLEALENHLIVFSKVAGIRNAGGWDGGTEMDFTFNSKRGAAPFKEFIQAFGVNCRKVAR